MSASSVATGVLGNAHDFNGSTDHLTVENNASYKSDSLTISAWVKPDTSPGTYSKIIDLQYMNEGFAFSYSIGRNNQTGGSRYEVVGTSGTTAVIDHGTLWSSTNWAQIAMTYEAGTPGAQRVYQNGVLHSHVSTASAGPVRYSDDMRIHIGARGIVPAARFINGALDEIRLSSIARSPDWITTEYNNESALGTHISLGTEQDRYVSTGTLTSNIFSTGFTTLWGTLSATTLESGTFTIKVRTDDAADMSGASD